MQTLNIIGAGRLGQTLGRLAQQAGYGIGSVLCRSAAAAEAACAFIGAGKPHTALHQVAPAALTLLAWLGLNLKRIPDAVTTARHSTE